MKRGRPPIPINQRKRAGISLRLTDDERERVLQLASEVKLDPSEWIRATLLGEKCEPPPAPQPPNVLDWRSVGIYMVTPSNLTTERWEMLRRYVCEVLKPD